MMLWRPDAEQQTLKDLSLQAYRAATVFWRGMFVAFAVSVGLVLVSLYTDDALYALWSIAAAVAGLICLVLSISFTDEGDKRAREWDSTLDSYI